MKKKLVATLASVCLVAVLGVGATLAYYTSTTEEKVNTFTIGNVDIEVTEPDWEPEDGKDLVPGAKVAKNPIITNTGASSGYMMLEVKGMDEMAKLGFGVKNGTVGGYNTADWTLVDANGNKIERTTTDAEGNTVPDTSLVDGYYVYKEAVATGASTSPLFTSVVLGDKKEDATTTYQVVGEIVYDANGDVVMKDGSPKVKYTITGVAGQEFDTYKEAEEYVMNNYGAKASFVFDLTVKGYAIQSENVEYQNADGVYTWVDDLTGVNNTPATAE